MSSSLSNPSPDDHAVSKTWIVAGVVAGVVVLGGLTLWYFLGGNEEFSPDNPLKDSPEDTTKKFFQATK